MIFEQAWESREVLADWKLENIVPIFKKGRKEDPAKYRPASFTSVLVKSGKIMVNILGDIEKPPGQQCSHWSQLASGGESPAC